MQVKICGLTRTEDVACAIEAGADLLGFVFAESPRRITAQQAMDLAAQVPEHIKTVGVFVDEDPEMVREIMDTVSLDYVQLHGSESTEVCQGFGDKVIKAFRVRCSADCEAAAAYPGDLFLFDAYSPEAAGGTGLAFDHTLALDAARRWRIILAGGLSPETVAEAVRLVKPWGVDVSSGVESAPGIKDHTLIKTFIRNAKELL